MSPSADPAFRRCDALSIGRRPAAAMVAVLTAVLMLLPAAGSARADTPPAQLVWSTLSPPVSPPPLAYAAAAYDSDRTTVVLFGGVTSSGALSDDTWVWNGSTWRGYSGTQIVSPPARELAAMAFDPALHQLVLFGGRGAGGAVLGDTWAWNGASWYQINPGSAGQSPSPREGAAMAYDGHGDLVLFGGDGPAPGAGGTSGTTAGSAKTASAGTTTAPSTGSAGTAASATPTSGQSSTSTSPSGVLGDTWLWTSGGWVESPATGPAARTGASLAFDTAAGDAVMFGGSSSPIGSGTPGYISDTWSWNGSGWSALPAAAPATGSASGSGSAGPGPSPAPRFGAVAAYDPLAGGVVLFGGAGTGGALSDTWVWSGQGWASPAASGNPEPRAGAGAAYDAAAHQLVIFGGAGNAGEQTGGGTGGGYAGGNYGSTPGGEAGVLGGTSVLTAGAPVGLGGPAGTTPAKGPAPATSIARVAAPQASARPGTSAGTVARTGGTVPRQASTATPLQVLHRGGLVTLRGSGFSPGTAVTITFHSTPTVVGKTTSGPEGTFEVTVAVPQSAAPGTHHFVATGDGPSGRIDLLVATVKVVGAGSASSGGTTPAERASLVGLALALPFATWLVLGGLGRWRRKRLPAG